MAIPEHQLVTWSAQGAVQQSAATYATIKAVLEDPAAPYSNRSPSVFLQGSYGNDTNIYADSDVDVVISTSNIFYYDIDTLPDNQKTEFHRVHPGSGQYSYEQFKLEVTEWLRQRFGTSVRPGSKAIFVAGNGTRRDADVLPAAEFRHYFKFPNAQGQNYAKGIVFWKPDGTRIVNYPRPHSENCTIKHQATNQWYKRTVRVFKNMRNRMIEQGFIQEGIAPSYYLEGLLYNVPNISFGGSFQSTFNECMNYFASADSTQFTCANERHWLLREGQEVCWSPRDCAAFLSAVRTFWQNP
ncbi:nucleotidyltransferase [Microvirga sp. BT689]|uniref:nucleotidyltransferase domain-containing protein n=1 Tax=Microvirga arvi TaxID=2778731 RepID=UPI00194E765D|nr:nucleotidyltransferase [Microvirga arvi]MBM6579216.1 nucleotidyltransferase [Microvirga arvi]